RYTRGVAFGSAATIVCAGLVGGFGTLRPAVFVIDAMLLLLALAASRFGFRFLRKLVPLPHQRNGKRVVIYGAGDGGELLFRELRNNADLQRVPVAFLDDDPHKAGRMLHGLTITTPNGAGSIARLCRSSGAEELLVSTGRIPTPRLRDIVDECDRSGVAVRQMIIDIRTLTDEVLTA